jgi:hypothetical protein
MIQVLDGHEGPLTETKDMLGIAMDYYKIFLALRIGLLNLNLTFSLWRRK